MSKTQATKDLEKQIYSATKKQGIFGCYEVTIGWFGSERVDYITYDTKGVWRCYEVKVSLSDFRSKAKNTFVGHYNYYVLTKELYEKVKHEIPSHIGAYVEGTNVKRAKKQDLKVEQDVLKNSLIRSLSREAEKLYRNNDPRLGDQMKRRYDQEKKQKEKYRVELYNLRRTQQRRTDLKCIVGED
ncbi:hypothetical protein [Bacillus sp. Marseille-P3800]|uniref:hypothetical protein n=1 Tax=Bacillus sp. Marseille-P3800 TaxID=2014782 RepID=UPI00210044DF|nr:hypothetical protein [Bacillus sp. Marseille-P3800]